MDKYDKLYIWCIITGAKMNKEKKEARIHLREIKELSQTANQQ